MSYWEIWVIKLLRRNASYCSFDKHVSWMMFRWWIWMTTLIRPKIVVINFIVLIKQFAFPFPFLKNMRLRNTFYEQKRNVLVRKPFTHLFLTSSSLKRKNISWGLSRTIGMTVNYTKFRSVNTLYSHFLLYLCK